MAVYLVTWDLNKEGAGYSQARRNLVTALSRYDHIKDQGLDSVWFLSTSWSAERVSNDLTQHIDTNDSLIVTKMVSGTHQGWLAKSTWDWINARL